MLPLRSIPPVLPLTGTVFSLSSVELWDAPLALTLFAASYSIWVLLSICALDMLPEDFTEMLRQQQTELGFPVTGILPGAGRSLDLSLKEFCEKVYRTSELMGDEIVAGRA